MDNIGEPYLLCENSTITLTCEANSTCGEPIYQWVSSLDYETFDKGLSVIEVELRPYAVNYSCVVTDGYITGYASITIISNGTLYPSDVIYVFQRVYWSSLVANVNIITATQSV